MANPKFTKSVTYMCFFEIHNILYIDMTHINTYKKTP